MRRYPRDFTGYGKTPPSVRWPNGAKIAVQFVLNFEEGAENNILHGDDASEAFLSEISNAAPWPGKRHWNMESLYEYGARAGFWRLHQFFTERNIPLTIFAVTTALERAPLQCEAMIDAGWEIACHGLKWIDYKDYDEKDERQAIRDAIKRHTALTGQRPLGWYTGRCSMNTVALVAEIGGFSYQSDSYADDLPFWHETASGPQLMLPYSLDCNDMRFTTSSGFATGDDFYHYLTDSFDTLYQEGESGSAKMMSIGLHCRLIGKAGRFQALKRFVDYVASHDNVWFARRIDIADLWAKQHPYQPHLAPSKMDKPTFMSYFGNVFEHSPWIAEGAFETELGLSFDRPHTFHTALVRIFRNASYEQRYGVLCAHPDLAGKLAAAKMLTQESTNEQASAGLDSLTETEKQQFSELNDAYVKKFNHPFIIAVRGLSKQDILAAFHQRIQHDKPREFDEACQQVEKIAFLRICEAFDSNQSDNRHAS